MMRGVVSAFPAPQSPRELTTSTVSGERLTLAGDRLGAEARPGAGGENRTGFGAGLIASTACVARARMAVGHVGP